MSQETRTETKTTYASEHDARHAVTSALLKPNVTKVWWSYLWWEKDRGAKPYQVTVETILKEPTLPDFDTMLRDDGPNYEAGHARTQEYIRGEVSARTWDAESTPDEPISRS